MKFEGNAALLQQKMAGSSLGVARRLAVMDNLNLAVGDTVLDVGCGAGHLVEEIALAVGSAGIAVGLDASETQLCAANLRCSDFNNVKFMCSFANNVDMPDQSCDAIASIQTLEYIEDVDACLAEVARLLKPTSVFINVSVLWEFFKFHGPEGSLNNLIHDAFKAHCCHQMLPLELPGKLAQHGIGSVKTDSLALLLTQRHANSPATYAEILLASFAIDQGVSEEKVADWRAQLQQAEIDGRFGFNTFPVLTRGTKT
tara:strand:- start:208 stop:978 length:771 start_codon:yes stop_codon:yes gene_type:complete